MKHCFAPLATATAALAAGLVACDGPVQSLAPEAAPLPSQAVSATGYTLTDLGTLGGWYSYAFNVNDRGMVVGGSLSATGLERAFVWIPGPNGTGTMQDLGTLPGEWVQAGAYAINNVGDIAGQVMNADFTRALPVRWNRLPSGEYRIEALEHLNGHKGGGNAINNRGDVAGADCLPGLKSHITIWSREGIRNLGNMGANAAIAYDMSDEGRLVVNHFPILNDIYTSSAYLWSEGNGFQPIGGLGGTGLDDETIAWGINNHGEVAGHSLTPAGVYHAFFWSEEAGMEDLGTLGGQYSWAFDVNGGGEVVGESETADGWIHGFIWSRGRGMRDIGALVEGGYSSAGATNGPGLIVGGSDTPDGEFHAVVWTPGVNAGLAQPALSTGRAPSAALVRPGGRARPSIVEVRSRIERRQ
jgi:probable HAF family extracellular repeat protein